MGKSQVKRQIDALVRGTKFTPNRFVPSVVGQPWNNITAIHVINKNTEYLGKDVAGIVGRQAGLWTGSDSSKVFVDIEFRILSVAVWSAARHVTIYPQDLVAGTEVELTRIDGSYSESLARAGYSWPASNQSFVLDSISGSVSSTKHVLNVELSEGARTELHFKMLWRSSRSMALKSSWVFEPRKPDCGPGLFDLSHRDNAADVRGSRISEECDIDGHSISGTSSLDDLVMEIKSLRDEVRTLKQEK